MNSFFKLPETIITASSPDRQKDFGGQASQQRWNEFSAQTIEIFAKLLPTFPDNKPEVRDDIRCPPGVFKTSAGCAFAFLANQRRIIAKELKHKPFTHQFGWFNKPGFRSSDDFNLKRDIPGQSEAIHNQVMALAKDLGEKSYCDYGCYDIKKKSGEDSSVIYIIRVKDANAVPALLPVNASDYDESIDVELTVTFTDYGKDNPETSILVEHPVTPFDVWYQGKSEYMADKFKDIEPVFQACIKWTPENGIDSFLKNIGRLAHFFAQNQLVGKGNSAIVEWMMRGLAKHVGIELGAFNYDEKIGWDFKAFLTPNRDDYAEWFAKKAFVQPEYHPTSTNKPGY